MQIQGKLRQVSAPQIITSKTTGKQYNKITFVVEFYENGNQYPQSVALETLNDGNVNVLKTLNVGAGIIVKFDCEAREYNGKYYNILKAWSIAPATQTATQPAQPVPTPAPAPTPVAVEQTDIDGLPF